MKKLLLLISILLLIAPVGLWGSATAEPIAIVVNERLGIDNLSSGELSRIYKGQLETWSDGQRIFVIDRPMDSKIREQFYGIVLNASPDHKFFKRGSPVSFDPMISKSPAMAGRMISRVSNAIAYVYLSKVKKGYKILKIDGRLPTDSDYKLVGGS